MTTACGSEDEVVALLTAAFPLATYTAGPFGVDGTSYPDAAVLEGALRSETVIGIDSAGCGRPVERAVSAPHPAPHPAPEWRGLKMMGSRDCVT